MKSMNKMAAMTAVKRMNIQTLLTNVLEMSGELTCSDPGTWRAASLQPTDFTQTGGHYADYFMYARTGSKRTTCHFVLADREANVADGRNVSVAFRPGWRRIYCTPAAKKGNLQRPQRHEVVSLQRREIITNKISHYFKISRIMYIINLFLLII